MSPTDLRRREGLGTRPYALDRVQAVDEKNKTVQQQEQSIHFLSKATEDDDHFGLKYVDMIRAREVSGGMLSVMIR